MNTVAVNRRRSVLPALNFVLAGGAVVLAVIAIAADDVGSAASPAATPAATTPVVTVVGPAHPFGAPSVGIPCDELVYTRC